MKKIILLASFFIMIFFVINSSTSFVNQTQAQGWTAGQQIVSGGNTGLPETTASEVVLNILKWLLGLVFLLTVLAFVGSGIMFIMSFSNSGITSMAKDWLTYAIIGLVVSVLGFAIVLAISNILLGRGIGGQSGSQGNGGYNNSSGRRIPNISVWGSDNNGNSVDINTGPGGATVDGRLGPVDFSLPIPIPGSPGTNSEGNF